MDKLYSVLIFAAGALVGSVVTWKLVKDKYERIADEEIESVKETFGQKFEPKKFEPESHDEEFAGPYVDAVKDYGYSTEEDDDDWFEYSEEEDEDDEDEEGGEFMRDPYLIKPEEFGQHEQYRQLELTYYADDVLANEWDKIIDNPDELLGEKFRDWFGLYEDDATYIRDDAKMTDYEVLRDPRTYREVCGDPEEDDG